MVTIRKTQQPGKTTDLVAIALVDEAGPVLTRVGDLLGLAAKRKLPPMVIQAPRLAPIVTR